MRLVATLAAVLTLAAAAAGPARAGSPSARSLLPPARLQIASPDGRRVVEVRPSARGGDAVWVGGRMLWPGRGAAQMHVTSAVVWSRRGDAVAFVARERRGGVSLVVVLVGECASSARGGGCEVASVDATPSLAWPIPASALPVNVVTWLGPSSVAAGPVELQPRVVASWRAATWP